MKTLLRTTAVAAVFVLLVLGVQNAQSHKMDGSMAGMSMPSMNDVPAATGAAIGAAIGGGYSLTNQDGKTVTDKDFKGKYQLIYFGFTFCPDICPLDLRKMTDALKTMDKTKAAKIAPVFITIDPERDTPKVLKGYVASFSPDLTGLTGTKDQIKTVEGEYKVYAAKAETKSSSDYTMSHSAYLYLMGPDGKFIDVLDPADKPADIAAKLNKSVQ